MTDPHNLIPQPDDRQLAAQRAGSLAISHDDLLQAGRIGFEVMPGGLHAELPEGIHLGIGEQVGALAPPVTNRVETEIEDTVGNGFNFIVGVTQLAHGPVGLYAKPTEGFMLHVGDVDPDTSAVFWRSVDDKGEAVALGSTEEMSLASDVETNPDTKTLFTTGIFKLTDLADPLGSYRVFAVNTEHAGKPDDWAVTGEVNELQRKK